MHGGGLEDLSVTFWLIESGCSDPIGMEDICFDGDFCFDGDLVRGLAHSVLVLPED